jgi:hypothetical protein
VLALGKPNHGARLGVSFRGALKAGMGRETGERRLPELSRSDKSELGWTGQLDQRAEGSEAAYVFEKASHRGMEEEPHFRSAPKTGGMGAVKTHGVEPGALA